MELADMHCIDLVGIQMNIGKVPFVLLMVVEQYLGYKVIIEVY